ncbi:iron chaperone [Sphingobacterium thermophilum]|uniref:DUF1801 domain-containing protein n=1 Tax=Sphingobacterium thermophilum TaxID=768534 RepID=A0ABP8QV56_9SPHI
MKEKDFNTIDEYIANQDKMFQKRLHELKQIILEVSPLQIQEKISYRIPTFWRNGNIIHFAQHAKHIGLYPGPEAIKVYKEKLVNYKTSKGTIQIPNHHPLDKSLIQELVRFNIERLENKVLSRQDEHTTK